MNFLKTNLLIKKSNANDFKRSKHDDNSKFYTYNKKFIFLLYVFIWFMIKCALRA